MEANLVSICGIAFVTVMLLLSLLAGSISLMTRLLPEKPAPAPSSGAEPELAVAIQSAVHQFLPGCRVTHIKED